MSHPLETPLETPPVPKDFCCPSSPTGGEDKESKITAQLSVSDRRGQTRGPKSLLNTEHRGHNNSIKAIETSAAIHMCGTLI